MIADGCERWRAAIVADADGHSPAVERRLVVAHVRRCPDCRAFATGVELQPRARTGTDGASSSRARRITAAVAQADRDAVPVAARLGLTLVAAHLVVLAVGDLTAPEAHDARHVGSFSLAYAIALVVVVARPARARTVLPVSIVLAASLVITAVVDTARGSTEWLTELRHVPEVASVALLWWVSRAGALPAPRRARGTKGRT